MPAAPSTDGDLRLGLGSPAINAGNNCVLTNTCSSNNIGFNLTFDLRGLSRPIGATVDMGAYEVNYALVASSGTQQSAAVNTAFANPLLATLTESGQPVSGTAVTFTAPLSGASASFTGLNPVTTNASGQASINVTANSIIGSYQATASVPGLSPVNFNLANTCQVITVNPPATNIATVDAAFSATFTQSGGGTTTFSTASALPTGITLSAAGVLSGVPTQTGVFPITVKATDSNGCMGTASYTLQVVRLTGSISDPLVACTGPGGLATGTIQISNPAASAQAFTLTTTFTNYAGIPGSCVLTGAAAGATCTVTAGGLTASGNILANTTLTVSYQAQVATVPTGTILTASNVATLGGSTLQPNPLVFSATVNCPSPGPGQVFSATSEASDQKAGSVLIYNVYTSSTDPTKQNTRLNLTNTHPTLPAYVHLFFVAEGCSVADSYVCLTANQTTSFLASDLDPGTTGYLVAVAVDGVRGCPTNFNYLIGDEYVKFASGHAANLGAESFAAIAGGLPACDGQSVTAQLNFDGISYNRAPAVLALSNVGSRADGNDTLLILNRIGGNLGTGAATLGTLFGVFYDDAENALSFSVAGNCQLRNSITNNFPRTTPRFESFIPAGRTGWLKVFNQTGTVGITGAAINFNANSASSAGAFNQGHNLHTLTLNATSNYVIPIFPPSC